MAGTTSSSRADWSVSGASVDASCTPSSTPIVLSSGTTCTTTRGSSVAPEPGSPHGWESGRDRQLGCAQAGHLLKLWCRRDGLRRQARARRPSLLRPVRTRGRRARWRPMTAASWPALGIPPVAVPAWRALTASLEDREPCCSSDSHLWFSRRPDETEAACHRCHGCHALTACGEYAEAAHERAGVWAGHDRTRRGRTQRRTQATEGELATALASCSTAEED